MEKIAFNDALLDALIDQLRLTEPEALCESGNRISKVCANPNCKVAMRCSNPSCKHCGFNYHPTCLSFDLPCLTYALNNRLDSHKEMVSAVIDLDNQLITAVEASKSILANEYQERNMSPIIQVAINKIYKEKSLKQISGREGKLLFEKMSELNSQSKAKMDSLVKKYKNSIEKMIQEVAILKRALFQIHIPPRIIMRAEKWARISAGNDYYFSNQSMNQYSLIDSKILTQKDPATPQNLKFIDETLGKYQKLQLLYRGSENNFSAAAFHKKCGEVENTLTLVRTEFRRTIAAFTPYKWHSSTFSQNWVSNSAGGSWILSLDRREKLIPTDTSKLMYNGSNWGPIFGSGFDLAICDQCDTKNDSHIRTGYSYNTVDRKYKDEQASYTALSGATNTKNFRVVEYQVFRVIR